MPRIVSRENAHRTGWFFVVIYSWSAIGVRGLRLVTKDAHADRPFVEPHEVARYPRLALGSEGFRRQPSAGRVGFGTACDDVREQNGETMLRQSGPTQPGQVGCNAAVKLTAGVILGEPVGIRHVVCDSFHSRHRGFKMARGKWFKWTVEFSVHQTWVEDGFELTDERAKDLIENALPHSYSHETKATVLLAPLAEEIAKVQGHEQPH